MRFLEKNLEDIIHENPYACKKAGLDIISYLFPDAGRFRQLNLSPYGIADLVNIRYCNTENTFFIQVIELKKEKIDLAAYAQAKRYQTALKSVVEKANDRCFIDTKIEFTSILIGRTLDYANDFVFVINSDPTCQVYTYSYGVNGISFEKIGKGWIKEAEESSSVLPALSATLYDIKWAEIITDNLRGTEYAEESRIEMIEYGDDSQPIIIARGGAYLNEYISDEAPSYAERPEALEMPLPF